MKNIGQMMKQAQQIQQKMADMQRELEELEVTGKSGGGMCQVTLNGKGVAYFSALTRPARRWLTPS